MQMEIEIAEPGRMMQTGSSMRKLIQNNSMPVLDLLVRESIQNSLDARRDDAEYVNVDFLKGKFNSDLFISSLEKIGDKLKNLYPDYQYDYLAVRDSKTVGLTGELHYDYVTDENNYGNLLKLVYEISKAQDAEGAGGSWGLGKTVYYRIGIGLVVYYSRVKLDSYYQSRLAVTFVEDETSDYSVIPPAFNGRLKRGIAWWGKKISANKTQPITDEVFINTVLGWFGIDPYRDDETGTAVIIPYINEQMLLENNETEDSEDDLDSDHHKSPYWKSSIEEYLKISVQRWFTPRLNNPCYKEYGPYLHVFINGKPIETRSMEPVFHVIQQLYNKALDASWDIDIKNVDVKREEIRIRKVLNNEVAGIVVFSEIDRDVLKMGPPDNKPSPYLYLGSDIKQTEVNKPIISFTRKPGMIVSYQYTGNWADGLTETDTDKYIVGIFVLNSDNTLQKPSDFKLEEYIRKSEMADHSDWDDYIISDSAHGNYNPKIIARIQKQIISKINAVYAPRKESDAKTVKSGWGKLFGELLLPPQGFGKKSSEKNRRGREGQRATFPRNSLTVIDTDTVFSNSVMTYHLVLRLKSIVNSYRIDIGIDSESGIISMNEWQYKLGLKMPFEIVMITIQDNNDLQKHEINSDKSVFEKNGEKYELSFSGEAISGVKWAGIGRNTFHFWISLKADRKDVIPAFYISELEGEIQNG